MKIKRGKKILIATGILLILLVSSFFIYVSIYYHATPSANNYLKTSNNVNVVETNQSINFSNNKDNTKGFIFYQGAKVEAKAYSQLAYEIAENNIDVFIVKSPFNLAFFNTNDALSIINSNKDINKWYLGGHSLGGAMISNKALDSSLINGIVFLGSYSNKDLSNSNLRVLLIKGSEDKVIKISSYQENKKLLPSNYIEHIIKGGNHAGFGDYGKQKGDGLSLLKPNEQISISAKLIADFINNK